MTHTALLVIDVINFCCHEKNERPGITFNRIRQMVPKLKEFIEVFKEKNGNVIFINTVPWTKLNLPININKLYENPKKEFYSKDSSGFNEEFYLLEPEKDDIIIEKNSYDAFTNLELDRVLKKNKIDELFISGVFGDGCVDATIRGAFSNGYDLVILKDLIETTDEEIRQELQGLLKRYTWQVMYGEVIRSNRPIDLFT